MWCTKAPTHILVSSSLLLLASQHANTWVLPVCRDAWLTSVVVGTQDDGLSFEDMGILLDAFPEQPLDFFGALRSALYDDQIRDWIQDDVLETSITNENANLSEVSRRLVRK